MNLNQKTEALIREIISSYKGNGMLVTGIELTVSPKQLPELRIGYFDINKKELYCNVSVLDVNL